MTFIKKLCFSVAVFVAGLVLFIISLSCGVDYVSRNYRFEPKDYVSGKSVVVASVDGKIAKKGVFKIEDITVELQFKNRAGRVLIIEEIETNTCFFRFEKEYTKNEFFDVYEVDVVVTAVKFNNVPWVIVGAVVMLGSATWGACETVKARRRGLCVKR